MNALKGIKIIDFTRLLPGPLATHMLAQMGAEVIKIESPKRMDYTRYMGPQTDGASTLFHMLNHNKSIKHIDYNTAEGKDELVTLIKSADVLIEQFRPGAMDSWGLGYNALIQINPQLIYISLTGYGQSGTWKDEAGHDFNYLAQAGIMSQLKDDNGKPVVPGFQLGDIGGGSFMVVMACQAALLQRGNTQKGVHVDVSMTDGVMPLLAVPLSLHLSGLDPDQFNVLDGKKSVNYAAYQCKDGKWLSVGAVEIKFWNNIANIIGRPDWCRSHELELTVEQFPKEEVIDLFLTKTQSEWMALFRGQDVCIAPILEIHELEDQTFHQERHSFENFYTPNGKALKTLALPFKFKS